MTTNRIMGQFGPRLLAHMDEQIASAHRLLDLVSQQATAIRARDVDMVVRRLADIDLEMARRQKLELERSRILAAAAEALGLAVEQVRLEMIAEHLLTPTDAPAARRKSSELQALLSRVSTENDRNRALMRQELAFLDHLLRLAGQPAEPGYRPFNAQRAQPRESVLDLRA